VSGIGIGERAERIFILAVTSIMGFPYYGVILIVVLASLTFIQRFIYIIKKLEK
jgi:archaetidylinositol phosphate synthase